MKPFLTVLHITLSQVDLDDFTYSLSTERDIVVDAGLMKSIARYGILHLPIIREIESGLYAIVSGRKRLLAWQELHDNAACCCLVIPRPVAEAEVFHVLLEEMLLVGQPTAIEKAIFLQKISAAVDERRIAGEFLPRLGHAPHPSAVKQTLKLLELEEVILQGVHQGQINETVARDFLSLSARDRMLLFEIITSLQLSFSNQKKLLSICREIAGRENTDIAALLAHAEVHEILQHKDANPPQKTKNLMTWLAHRHMPLSTQAEEEFTRFVSGLRLPGNVSVEHTPFFEDNSMILTMTFQDRKSLQHAWGKIRHAAYDSAN